MFGIIDNVHLIAGGVERSQSRLHMASSYTTETLLYPKVGYIKFDSFQYYFKFLIVNIKYLNSQAFFNKIPSR